MDQELDPDPDPLARGTDTGIRIRTKMSRIPNTARYGTGSRLKLIAPHRQGFRSDPNYFGKLVGSGSGSELE
jgi:hypothetical protein